VAGVGGFDFGFARTGVGAGVGEAAVARLGAGAGVGAGAGRGDDGPGAGVGAGTGTREGAEIGSDATAWEEALVAGCSTGPCTVTAGADDERWLTTGRDAARSLVGAGATVAGTTVCVTTGGAATRTA
jgi:hypothetical protein